MMNLPAQPWIRLLRFDRPIGTLLLLWPTLWSVWFAAEGLPDTRVVVIFCLGVVVMRAAGCVINDYADREIDGHVLRTKSRPLVTGEITPQAALKVFAGLLIVAFLLVLQTNTLTVILSFIGALLVTLYPFVKRWTYLPQIVLGLTWGWVVPMSFAANRGLVPLEAWALYVAVVLWTVAFDTFYAMVDREDDERAGIKSIALLWGDKVVRYIGLLQMSTMLLLVISGVLFSRTSVFFLGLGVAASLFILQILRARKRRRDAYFKAFLDNHWVGMVIFVFLAWDFWLYPAVSPS